MKTAPNVEILAHVDDLAKGLAELGPISKTEDPLARSMAKMMQTMLTFIRRNMDAPAPDEEFQRRMLDAAKNEYHQLKLQLVWVPAQRAKDDRSKGGKKAAVENRRRAKERDARLIVEAKKIRATNPSMSINAIARKLADRPALGNADVIRKKLSRLLSD